MSLIAPSRKRPSNPDLDEHPFRLARSEWDTLTQSNREAVLAGKAFLADMYRHMVERNQAGRMTEHDGWHVVRQGDIVIREYQLEGRRVGLQVQSGTNVLVETVYDYQSHVIYRSSWLLQPQRRLIRVTVGDDM